MRRNLRNRDVAFRHEDGCLVRTVTGAGGRTYTHRCSLKVFERAAWALQETPAEGEGTTLEIISRRENLAFTQVNVALEFMKERGLVDVRQPMAAQVIDRFGVVHLGGLGQKDLAQVFGDHQFFSARRTGEPGHAGIAGDGAGPIGAVLHLAGLPQFGKAPRGNVPLEACGLGDLGGGAAGLLPHLQQAAMTLAGG